MPMLLPQLLREQRSRGRGRRGGIGGEGEVQIFGARMVERGGGGGGDRRRGEPECRRGGGAGVKGDCAHTKLLCMAHCA